MTERQTGYENIFQYNSGDESSEPQYVIDDPNFIGRLNDDPDESFQDRYNRDEQDLNPFETYIPDEETEETIDLEDMLDFEIAEYYQKASELYLQENKEYGSLSHSDLYNYALIFEKYGENNAEDNTKALRMAGSCYLEALYSSTHGFSRKQNPFDNETKNEIIKKAEDCFVKASENCDKSYDEAGYYRNLYNELFIDVYKEITIEKNGEIDINPEIIKKTSEDLYLVHLEIDKIISQKEYKNDVERRMLIGISGQIAAASDFLAKFDPDDNPIIAAPASYRGNDGNYNKAKTHNLVLFKNKGNKVSTEEHVEIKRTTSFNYLRISKRSSNIIFANKAMSTAYIADPNERNLLYPIHNDHETTN